MRSVCLLPQAPAVLTSAHHPRVSESACGHTGVSLAEHAWACVCMRGPAPGLQGHAMRRACAAAKGTAVPNIGRYTSLRATTRTLFSAHIVQLWRTQVEHAHGCVAWAHLHLSVLDQLEYKVSSEPSSGRATRLVPASSATSRAAHQDICSRCSGLTSWVEG